MMDGDADLVDTNVLLTATTPARALHGKALEVLNEWPARGQALLVSGRGCPRVRDFRQAR